MLDAANGGVTLSRGQKRAIETAPLNPKEGSPADISTADGAKVLNNLDYLAKKIGKYYKRTLCYLFLFILSIPQKKRRGLLAFKTMYKKKSGTGSSDGLMPDASPSTPLAPSDISNSAGKVTDNSGNGQKKMR